MSIDRTGKAKVANYVVTLSKDPELSAYAYEEILRHKAITTASLEGCYLPVGIPLNEVKSVREWLGSLPGVADFDVVFSSEEKVAD